MVLIVKLPRTRLLELARTRGVGARLGPTSSGGWTVAWYETDDDFDTAEFRGPGSSSSLPDRSGSSTPSRPAWSRWCAR